MPAAKSRQDERMLDLMGFMDAHSLGKLAFVSRALYVYAHVEELWKTLVVQVWGHAACFGFGLGIFLVFWLAAATKLCGRMYCCSVKGRREVVVLRGECCWFQGSLF